MVGNRQNFGSSVTHICQICMIVKVQSWDFDGDFDFDVRCKSNPVISVVITF